jgi:nitrogenase molybdenum-cofactor synthesis protein NifE
MRAVSARISALIAEHKPAGAFIYSTCLAGVIGDDVDAVCKAASTRHGIPVIPVQAPGFAGTKITGYRVACDALATLVGTGDTSTVPAGAINILGDFNLAGELWTIKSYYQVMGVPIISTITGDARINDIRRAHGAALNVVQCSGSMIHLARDMERRFGIPYIQVSYVGFEDTAAALYAVAEKLVNTDAMQRAQELVRNEVAKVTPELRRLKKLLAGRTVALYTGGAFKALSLVRALRSLGMRTVLAGCQTGGDQDYQELQRLCDPDTVIVDDITTHELGRFLARGGVDLFIGGVKERPLAYKLGIAFCDHNHERKHGLAGFDGMLTFAEEVFSSVSSPVWKLPVTRGEMG